MPRPIRVTEWSAIPAETASYYPHASVAHPVGGEPAEVGAAVSGALGGLPPQEPVAEVEEAKAEPAQQQLNPSATLTSVALSDGQAPQEFIPEDPKGPVERPESVRIPEIGAGAFSLAKWDELAPDQMQNPPNPSSCTPTPCRSCRPRACPRSSRGSTRGTRSRSTTACLTTFISRPEWTPSVDS